MGFHFSRWVLVLHSSHVLLFLSSLPTAGSFIPFGLQTGNANEINSSYATSMAFDQKSREMTITGGTYSNYFSPGEIKVRNEDSGSDCFVAILHLPHEGLLPDSNAPQNVLSWQRRRQFGSSTGSEFCSGIHVGRERNILAIGQSGEGGLLTDLRPYGSHHSSVYGMILDMDDNVALKGGMLLHSSSFQLPTSITTDTLDQYMYVAEIFSDDEKVNPEVLHRSSSQSSTAYYPLLFGMRCSVRIQKFYRSNWTKAARSEGIAETLQPSWSREFGTFGLENVHVAGLSYISPTTMVMTGSTAGVGEVFGFPSDDSVKNLDGFVTILDPSNGSFVRSKRIESKEQSGNDRISGICQSEVTASKNELYVVGTTDGVFDSKYLQSLPNNENHAFLLKIDLHSMEVVWSRQIGGQFPEDTKLVMGKGAQVHGVACAVTADGEHVYLAGDVNDGSVLSILNQNQFPSAGSNDIFVSKFRTENGELEWAKQVGSPNEDSVARGNSLATDSEGNLVLLGNTFGSFFREKEENGGGDIFVMSFAREDGESLPPYQISGKKDSSGLENSTENLSGYEIAAISVSILLVFVGLVIAARRRRQNAMHGCSTENTGEHAKNISPFSTHELPCAQETLSTTGLDNVDGLWKRDGFLVGGNSSTISATFAYLKNRVLRPRASRPERPPSDDRKGDGCSTSGSSCGSSDSSRRRDQQEKYGEIFDLLSIASERLDLGRDDSGSDSESTANNREKSRPMKNEDDVTLEDLDKLWELT